MKKTGMVFVVYVCVVCGSVFAINYWEGRHMEPARHARPEGYQQPTAHDQKSPKAALNLKREGRITKLEIAPNVPKYFGEKLELVALAPGSGWLRFFTSDDITPTLKFKKVTQGEIQQFNAFALSKDSPIRVALVGGNTLHITAEETVADLAYFKGKGKALASAASYKSFGFNQKTDTAPKVVLKKDNQGHVFLVRAKDQGEKMAEVIAAND